MRFAVRRRNRMRPDRDPRDIPAWRVAALHVGLLALTLLTTTVAGAEWVHQHLFFVADSGEFRWRGWLTGAQLLDGLGFSLPFLGILTVHEFGHFLTARYHGVRTSWPFYLPFYLGFSPGIGTVGAVIRIRDRVYSRREFFDIGVAGPLAGFVVLVGVLVWALLTLPHLLLAPPPPGLQIGHNLLLDGLERLCGIPAYAHASLTRQPVVLAGYMGAFFTALNLLPIGQLDGGHVTYGLFGYGRAARISLLAFTGLVGYAGLGLIDPSAAPTTLAWAVPLYLAYLWLLARPAVPTPRWALLAAVTMLLAQVGTKALFPALEGNPGWLLLALLLARGIGLVHPPAPNETPLDWRRRVVGWLALGLLVLCYSPSPFE
ncbi:MAG: site-2 protease family protein [Hymenobacteraceae bacterium]|nr:site-2 protease family protein [Hymenobacteraceae bacterium]